MSIELDFRNLTMPQMMVNRACLEDTLSIQTQCTTLLDTLKDQVLAQLAGTIDPKERMALLTTLLTQQKTQLKTYKDRLHFWDRQEQLVGVSHELVATVMKMVTKVDAMVTEAIEELALLAQLSQAFLGVLDAAEKLFMSDADACDANDASFETRQTAPSTRTLQ